MSYIRASEEPQWEPEIGEGWYVYSDTEEIRYLPREHKPFIEVVMRMLDQSGELDDEALDAVHAALRTRLRIDNQPTASDGGNHDE